MSKAVYLLVGCVLAGGTLLADSISLTGGTMQTFGSVGFSSGQTDPTPSSSGTPFWNNYSYDTGVGGSHDMNIGYLLSGTGGFTGTDVFNGLDSVSTAGVGPSGSDPSSFTFAPNNAQNYDVTLLSANSGNSTSAAYGTIFGLYYVSGVTTTLVQLYGPGANAYTDTSAINLTGAERTADSYGFYATVCYGTPVDGVCPENETETYYSNSSLNSGIYGSTANHFAVFGLSSSPSNDFAIAFEDGRPGSAEGTGDFNDIVIQLADPAFQTAPEPATFAFVGLGLVGLGLSRRFKKV
jgi:hypothetical protein